MLKYHVARFAERIFNFLCGNICVLEYVWNFLNLFCYFLNMFLY